MSFIQTLTEDDIDDLEIKLTVLGDASVGKTQLLQRYCNNIFSNNSLPTIGFDYLIKEVTLKDFIDDVDLAEDIQTKCVTLKFWDTAGQERFRSLTSSFFKGTAGFIIVYDISNQDSFNNLSLWLNIINENAEADAFKNILIIGNKNDLEEYRIVSLEQGKDFADKNNLLFAEVSAKYNGDNCVGTAFEVLLKPVIKDMSQLVMKNIKDNETYTNLNELVKLKENNDNEKLRLCC